MSKAVLLSIRPQYCELIASGKKTMEVRKTRPKLEIPFKCYIYCTKGERLWKSNDRVFLDGKYKRLLDDMPDYLINGKVIGEFVYGGRKTLMNVAVDDWERLKGDSFDFEKHIVTDCALLTEEELHRYANGKRCYAWQIEKLVIYDRPKELSEFRIPCRESEKDHPMCGDCKYYYSESNESIGFFEDCSCNGLKHITRPPQSWCYVEEL